MKMKAAFSFLGSQDGSGFQSSRGTERPLGVEGLCEVTPSDKTGTFKANRKSLFVSQWATQGTCPKVLGFLCTKTTFWWTHFIQQEQLAVSRAAEAKRQGHDIQDFPSTIKMCWALRPKSCLGASNMASVVLRSEGLLQQVITQKTMTSSDHSQEHQRSCS